MGAGLPSWLKVWLHRPARRWGAAAVALAGAALEAGAEALGAFWQPTAAVAAIRVRKLAFMASPPCRLCRARGKVEPNGAGESMLRDDPKASRFEIDDEGVVVFADYRRRGDTLFIDHVETPPARRGRGAAGRLMAAIVEHAGHERLTIVPICAYAAAWMARRAASTGRA
jgi:hypothetical protein